MSRPPTPDEARHVNKKPRLDLDEEPINYTENAQDVQLDAPVIENGKSRGENGGKKVSKRVARKAKKQKHAPPEPYSNEHVILLDIQELLGESVIKAAEEEGRDWVAPFENKTELELTVAALSSTGVYAWSRWLAVVHLSPRCLLGAQDQLS